MTRRQSPLFAAFFLSALVTGTASADGEGVLTVDVLNLQNDEGQVGCSLFAGSEGFPSKQKKAVQAFMVTPKDRKAACTFKNVKPGTYAVSVMHDIDKDDELDSNLVGRPQEPWGVSNDAPMQRFGPPKYDDAKFDYDGEAKTIKIKLQS